MTSKIDSYRFLSLSTRAIVRAGTRGGGDPSFRVIPREATERDVRLYHLHVDNRPAETDLNCTFPLERLRELEQSGEVGESARSHYSYMGYILHPEEPCPSRNT